MHERLVFQVNLILFGGFFGSGKTSLILSLAHFLVKKEGAKKTELVIIENEVGEIGIDNKVIETSGFTVKEMFSGCICCQLTASLTLALNDIAEKINPKWVIVESTGLAYPGKILNTIGRHSKSIDNAVTITVVDSQRWEEYCAATPVLAKTQVTDGDIIIINKTDLVTEEQLTYVKNRVTELNPKAQIHKVSANQNVEDSVWEKVVGINE